MKKLILSMSIFVGLLAAGENARAAEQCWAISDYANDNCSLCTYYYCMQGGETNRDGVVCEDGSGWTEYVRNGRADVKSRYGWSGEKNPSCGGGDDEPLAME